MNTLWWIALHGLALVGLVALVGFAAPRAHGALKAQGHDARMARIAQLEIANGMSLVFARDWVYAQKPRGDGMRYKHIGELHCFGCGAQFERRGEDEMRLCRKCRRFA